MPITLDDPRVVEIMTGVERTGARGYRKDGRHYGLRKQLTAVLGIAIATADRLIKKAVLAGLLPVAETPVKPPKVAKSKPEPEPVTPAAQAAKTDESDQDQGGYVFKDENEPEDDSPAAPFFAICRRQLPSRYSLVTSKSRTRTFYGVFDSKFDSQWMVSEDRAIALTEVKRLNAEDKVKQTLPYYNRKAA